MSNQYSSDPASLEQQANATRSQIDETMGELEERLSIRRRVSDASEAIGAAASRTYRRASPEITTMIRLDHTHVLAAFRRYHGWLPEARKEAVVTNVCLALEIHAQLEEEIFYPALRGQGDDTDVLDKSVSEHDEMRALIQRLRQMPPGDSAYDKTFYELVRTVLHHVADEETTLLPLAESRLKDGLRELGWRMTVRRIELLKPHAGEIASTTARTFPVLTGALAAGLLALVWLVVRPSTNGAGRP